MAAGGGGGLIYRQPTVTSPKLFSGYSPFVRELPQAMACSPFCTADRIRDRRGCRWMMFANSLEEIFVRVLLREFPGFSVSLGIERSRLFIARLAWPVLTHTGVILGRVFKPTRDSVSAIDGSK